MYKLAKREVSKGSKATQPLRGSTNHRPFHIPDSIYFISCPLVLQRKRNQELIPYLEKGKIDLPHLQLFVSQPGSVSQP
jgi:hypothetical protein